MAKVGRGLGTNTPNTIEEEEIERSALDALFHKIIFAIDLLPQQLQHRYAVTAAALRLEVRELKSHLEEDG